MIDVRIDSIIYQSQIYYRDLVNTLVANKRLGKALDSKWQKADEILGYLESLNYRDRLEDEDDIINVNYILYCLIKLCELNQYPVSAPIEFQEPPAVLVGIEGPAGQSITGPRGETGLATDFQVSLISVPSVVDEFDIDDARAARWDYLAVESSGEQRAGSIIGHWTTDGSSVELHDPSPDNIGGDTEALQFSLEFLSGNIRLIATPASGTWTVIGSRYFIPNNGNGSGPISGVLADGAVYIGDASNIAQSRSISGDITITNTGVASITSGVILNADINATAAIALTKLAALSTGNRVLLSNGSGVIVESGVSNTTLAFLDVTSSAQTQLNTKLTDPTTTVGDIIIRNGSNNIARLGVGTDAQVLTVAGGVPTWSAAPGGISGGTTGRITKFTSATTIGNSVMTESGSTISVAGTLSASISLVGSYLTPDRVIVSTTGGALIVSNISTSDLENVVSNLDGLPAATAPYQLLMRNSSNDGFEWVNLATLKQLLNIV